MIRLGRTLGIVGFMIGILFHFLLTFLCCLRAPRHIIQLLSAGMIGMAGFAFVVLFGWATHFCSIRGGPYDCRVAVNGYLALVAVFLWAVGGVSLQYTKDRFLESSATSSDEEQALDTRGDLQKRPREEIKNSATGTHDNISSTVEAIPEGKSEFDVNEESTTGAASKASSVSVMIEREYFLDGREVVKTTKTSCRPDGTHVIETDTVTKQKPATRTSSRSRQGKSSNTLNVGNRDTRRETTTCPWLCDDLNQCDSLRDGTNPECQMTSTTSGLTDDTPNRI